MKIINWPRKVKSLTGILLPRGKCPELIILCLILLFAGCRSDKKETQSPSGKIIQQAIEVAGGRTFRHSLIEFDFRNRHYTALHDGGIYTYTRTFSDSTGQVHDVLSNDGFIREINGEKVDVVDSMARKYSNSVNSVIYFALLPDGLDDPAVISTLLGKKIIKGTSYDKVHVTFKQQGGGKDYKDEFIYWFDQKTHHLDYLAYTYEVDGGGIRFRTAYNPRTIDGIRFVDYVNYEQAGEFPFEEIDDAFLEGKLKELSRIELKNVDVSQQNEDAKL